MAGAGLRAKGLLEDDDPAGVIYSFALYERTADASRLRVSADSFGGALDVNEGVKLDLGSTAKLRALASYLEAVATLHDELAGLAPEALWERREASHDPLSAFVTETLWLAPDTDAAGAARGGRSTAATPRARGPASTPVAASTTSTTSTRTTTSGSTRCGNAFRHSVNLPFVRLMQDVVAFHVARLPGDPARMLRDREDPRRPIWLRRWQEEESRIFLARFYRYNAGKSRSAALAGWVERTKPTARRYAAAYRAVFPDHAFERFAAAMRRLPAAATLGDEDLAIKYRKYAPRTLLALRPGVPGAHAPPRAVADRMAARAPGSELRRRC